jgi:predicted metal-binding membrane protein
VSVAVPTAASARGPAAFAAARVRGVPVMVAAAVAAAWSAAIAAEATGTAGLVHHDALLAGGAPPVWAVLAFLASWQVMVAAMMLPSSLPLVRMFATASARAPGGGRAIAAFLGGYALVWTGFGALAFAGDLGLHTAVDASPFLEEHEWVIGGSVLALAGLFQFTPLKDACLDACRHPASFMLRHYRRGTGGGFALGARHGLFCVGCCWALMLVMFALGVASLVWMALLTALMVHEKTRPLGARTVPLTGVTLLALASIVLAYSWYASAAG